MRLFPNYELSRRNHGNVCCCPHCLQIIETVGHDPNTTCPKCGTVFDPRKGVSGRGEFRCPECGERQRLLDAVVRKGAALALELHALEAYCEACGRFFKRVDTGDLERWERAKAEFERCKENLLFPRQAIPIEGRSDPRPVNHGYTHFWQMFNERQLLCLSILLEQILRIPDQNIRELMLIAFSDCLDANNMFCKYEIEWHKISLFFGLHAYHPIERPAENNVWGTVFGRGTFAKCFEKVRRAKVYCQRPYERLLNLRGERYSQYTDGERIEGQLVSSFDELGHIDHGALLRCQSAEDLSFVPDNSVDAIITDPPYFDNVQYSELADFFYVWLRLALKDTYPWFQPELSSRPNEIVKNDRLGKTTDFFNEGLRRVFIACHRVLKDDGLLVFTFHHNQLWAWEGIAELLLDAGFYVSATPVVRSEGKSGFHSSKGNIRYDCILVCRKRPSLLAESSFQHTVCQPSRLAEVVPAQAEFRTESGPGPDRPESNRRSVGEFLPNGQELGSEPAWPALKRLILEDAVLWTRRTLQSGVPVNEVDVFTIVMGKTVEHYTKALVNGGHGYEVTLPVALSEMEDLVRRVGEIVQVGQADGDQACIEKVKQFSLFVLESRAKYGT